MPTNRIISEFVVVAEERPGRQRRRRDFGLGRSRLRRWRSGGAACPGAIARPARRVAQRRGAGGGSSRGGTAGRHKSAGRAARVPMAPRQARGATLAALSMACPVLRRKYDSCHHPDSVVTDVFLARQVLEYLRAEKDILTLATGQCSPASTEASWQIPQVAVCYLFVRVCLRGSWCTCQPRFHYRATR